MINEYNFVFNGYEDVFPPEWHVYATVIAVESLREHAMYLVDRWLNKGRSGDVDDILVSRFVRNGISPYVGRLFLYKDVRWGVIGNIGDEYAPLDMPDDVFAEIKRLRVDSVLTRKKAYAIVTHDDDKVDALRFLLREYKSLTRFKE